MAALSFSFSPEATAKVHDLLLCLAKFGELVSLEARGDQVSHSFQTFPCLVGCKSAHHM